MAVLRLRDIVDVSPSPIHGYGAFARRTIPAGTLIGTYEGPTVDDDGRYVLWLTWDGGCEGRLGENRLRFLNHSKEPNATFDEFDLYSLDSIERGAEITFDYGDDWQ